MVTFRRQPVSAADGSSLSDDQASFDYRRRARRLRHHFRGSPLKLHHALRQLSEDTNAARPATSHPYDRPLQGGSAAALAKEVAASLDGSVLRYSSRLALLQRAQELGIGRFEANLIIAMVQHQPRNPQNPPAIPQPRRGAFAAVAMVLAFETLIAGAAWLFVRG